MAEIPGDGRGNAAEVEEVDEPVETVESDKTADEEPVQPARQEFATAAASAETVIPIRWTKRVLVAKAQGHLGAGIGLFAFGLIGLFSPEHHLLMPVIAVLVAGSYLILAAGEFVHIRRGHESESPIGWLEVFAGLVVFVEALERIRPHRIFQPATFMMITALAVILMGLLQERLKRAFCLRVDDAGFRLRLRPFKVLTHRWSEIGRLTASADGRRVELLLKSGRRDVIRLRRVANRDEIRQAIASRIPPAQ